MKNKSTIFILSLSILLAIFISGLFFYILETIKDKNQQASTIVASLEDKMKQKENSIFFADKMSEIKAIQDSIDAYFINPDKIDIFVDFLENSGVKFGSEIKVNSIDIPTKTKELILFKVTITGSFQSVMDNISFIENMPYQIKVTSINLNSETLNQEQAPGWRADMIFTILSNH